MSVKPKVPETLRSLETCELTEWVVSSSYRKNWGVSPVVYKLKYLGRTIGNEIGNKDGSIGAPRDRKRWNRIERQGNNRKTEAGGRCQGRDHA